MINELTTFASSHCSDICAGILAGFILIILVFIFLRPWIYITPNICISDDGYHRFKIIHFSLVKCTEMQLFLRKVKEIDAYPKGKDIEFESIKIEKSFDYIIGIWGFFASKKGNCLQARYKCPEISEVIQRENEYIELILRARHGMSNLQITKSRKFKHIKYVKKGKFVSGLSWKIL